MGMILKLYGDLREKGPHLIDKNGIPSTLSLKVNNFKNILDILKKFNIEPLEISHIFVNGRYCNPNMEIKDGDRIGLFPKRMGLIFLEITKNN